MRILAIRGRNLASLAGEFAVDFQAEPLATAGLFAISGPTGAGKSTLLDALCLALYDDTPRLRSADGRGIELPDVGKETTLPNDRRNILRRGCSEGHAEVDFVGNDGVAWRARWSVRRARGKAGGKLQQSEMALTRIADGQPAASHLKSEVQRAIVDKIGLSFEQFTRAVLLAQNEFFTFLKAGEDERAALLQTLTGTDRFEQLSRRAFERNKLEQEKLRVLKLRLADQQPLTGEARAQHEAERATAKAALAAHEARDKALAARLRWHEELERARTREAAARAALDEARARHAQADERRRLLARVEAVQPARALVAECDRLAAERSRLAAQGAAADAAVAAAAQALGQAKARLDAAGAARAEIEAAQARLAPLIVQARALDTEIATLGPARARAAQGQQEAGAALERAQQGVTGNAAARHARLAEQAQVEAWLAARAPLAPLAESWPRWDALFGAAAEAHGACRTAQADVTRLEAEARTRAENLLAATTARTAADGALQTRSAEAAAATAAVQAIDLDALARRRTELDARRQHLQTAGELWRELVANRSQAHELAGEVKAQRAAAAAGEARLTALRTARPAAEAAAAQAERAWRVVFEATQANVESLRAQLQPDAPCPVCGATDHPYVAYHPALDNALARLAHDRDACRKAVADLTVEEQSLTREAASHVRQLGQLETRRAQLDLAHARLREDWQPAATRLAERFGPATPSADTGEEEGAQGRDEGRGVMPATPGAASAAPQSFAASRGVATSPGCAAALAEQTVCLAALAADHTRADVTGWLAACAAELAKVQEQLAEQEARHRQASARQQAAQQALDAARKTADAAREAHGQRQSEAERTAAAVQAARETRASGAERLAGLLAQLDAAHSDAADDWRTRWYADPPAWHEGRRVAAAEWLEKRAAATTLQAELVRLDTESRGLAELLAQAEARQRDAARALAELDDVLQARQAARRAVFAGMHLPGTAAGAAPRGAEALAATEIETTLGDATQAARAHQASEEQTLKAAAQRLAGETAAQAQLHTRATALEESARHAADALSVWLAAFDARGMGAGRSDAGGTSADDATASMAAAGDAAARGHTAAGESAAGEAAAGESATGEAAASAAVAGEAAAGGTAAGRFDTAALHALLARDAAWIGAERQALQQLEHAIAGAAGGLEQMRAQREAHERARPAPLPEDEGAPEDTPAAIQSALAELGTTLATLRERLGGCELALRRDDEIRHKAAELLHAIEAQEQAARIWWQMNELIGAADGKKFRNYAQQLTLDILLGYANAHLKDLARRYRLERVPSSLALMVIDQDMGDEQRSVHSLSGGESFLVSLALALGLASLSSHRVRVESLFIDEGFGSLDADTLRVAMDALDSLQAMGRKVGVISHVEEMTERIATRIHVRRLPGGQSRVEVSGAP